MINIYPSDVWIAYRIYGDNIIKYKSYFYKITVFDGTTQIDGKLLSGNSYKSGNNHIISRYLTVRLDCKFDTFLRDLEFYEKLNLKFPEQVENFDETKDKFFGYKPPEGINISDDCYYYPSINYMNNLYSRSEKIEDKFVYLF